VKHAILFAKVPHDIVICISVKYAHSILYKFGLIVHTKVHQLVPGDVQGIHIASDLPVSPVEVGQGDAFLAVEYVVRPAIERQPSINFVVTLTAIAVLHFVFILIYFVFLNQNEGNKSYRRTHHTHAGRGCGDVWSEEGRHRERFGVWNSATKDAL